MRTMTDHEEEILGRLKEVWGLLMKVMIEDSFSGKELHAAISKIMILEDLVKRGRLREKWDS